MTLRTNPWTDDDADLVDASTAELFASFDSEAAICALRRNYVIARVGGWPETAALRIAIRTVMDIVDDSTGPKLSVVK